VMDTNSSYVQQPTSKTSNDNQIQKVMSGPKSRPKVCLIGLNTYKHRFNMPDRLSYNGIGKYHQIGKEVRVQDA